MVIARFVVFHQRLIRTLRRSQVFQHWFWSDPLRKTWSWSHILAGGVCSAAVGKMLQHTVFAWPLCFMFDYGLLVINVGDLLLQTFFARGITFVGGRILRVEKHKDQPQTKEWLMFFLSQDIPPTLIPFNPQLCTGHLFRFVEFHWESWEGWHMLRASISVILIFFLPQEKVERILCHRWKCYMKKCHTDLLLPKMNLSIFWNNKYSLCMHTRDVQSCTSWMVIPPSTRGILPMAT